MAKRLIPVSNAELLKENGVPLSPKTLRSWHSRGKFKIIFVKLSGKLLLDLDSYDKLIDEIKERI